MSRTPPNVREARPEDVEELLGLWGEPERRPTPGAALTAPVADAVRAIARVAIDPDQRFVVAELAGRLVGAAHLIRRTVAPLSTEVSVHVTHLRVLDGFGHHGVGTALVDAAVVWAEEKDAAAVTVAASAQSREANRFLARLGLGQLAVVRSASVPALRAKLPVDAPACARVSASTHRSVRQVLTQRRSQRRARQALDLPVEKVVDPADGVAGVPDGALADGAVAQATVLRRQGDELAGMGDQGAREA